MNTELSQYARKLIKERLETLPESNQMMFKRMYSHEDLDKPIPDVVDAMPDDKLEHAMFQIDNARKRLGLQ